MRNKSEDKPHAKRLGWLKNGNPPGDPSKTIRCLAKTRSGAACKSPAMKNGRCRLHGGKSTGPRTPEGLARIIEAHFKHGEYTKEAREEQKQIRALMKSLNKTIAEINDTGGISFGFK